MYYIHFRVNLHLDDKHGKYLHLDYHGIDFPKMKDNSNQIIIFLIRISNVHNCCKKYRIRKCRQ